MPGYSWQTVAHLICRYDLLVRIAELPKSLGPVFNGFKGLFVFRNAQLAARYKPAAITDEILHAQPISGCLKAQG